MADHDLSGHRIMVSYVLMLSGRRRWSVYLYTLKVGRWSYSGLLWYRVVCMEVGLVPAGTL